MFIVEATQKDIPTIQKIAHETWPVAFKDILSTEQIDYMLEMMYSTDSITNQLLNLNHKYLLFKDDLARFTGYISYQVDYIAGATKIHKIYVLPEMQGRGIGKRLIEEVEHRAKLHKNRNLLLNVNQNNKAIQFYEHMGFCISKIETIDIGNGFFMEDYIMNKNIE